MNAKNKLRGLIGAAIIAVLMAIGPIAIGIDALHNTDTVPIQSAPAGQVSTDGQSGSVQLVPAASRVTSGGAPVLRTGGS